MSYSGIEAQMSYKDRLQDELKKGDYVHLRIRGDVWLIEDIDYHQGYNGDHLLKLKWVAGSNDPGRICKFGSGQARRLTAMEVIAVCSS